MKRFFWGTLGLIAMAAPALAADLPVAGAIVHTSQDVDMVTVRFNYRFGGYGAPLVARY